MTRIQIELDKHHAEQLDYIANCINGGTVRILIRNEAGNGWDEAEIRVLTDVLTEEDNNV